MQTQPRRCRLVVVGASAGGVEALQALVGALPHQFEAALLIVLHIGRRHSALPEILGRAGPLPATWAEEGKFIRPGWIYVAPRDQHMLVAADGRHLRLSRGPAENRNRPAIDPLFRSAAAACGPRLAGVLLSGLLSDGTAGLAAVAREGGATLVQDPEEAEYPNMPRSALRYVPVQHCLPVTRIAALLGRLCRGAPTIDTPSRAVTERKEVDSMEGYQLKRPVELTCPSCGGAVRQSSVDSMPYFECHIGHRFAAPDMDEAQFLQMEQAMNVALRVLNERVELCRRLAKAARDRNQPLSAGRWEAAMQEAHERAEVLRRFIERGWQRPSDDADEGGFAAGPRPDDPAGA